MNQDPKQNSKPLILIAEKITEMATLIERQLELAGMHSQICSEANHVRRFLRNNFANLLLTNVDLPDETGFQLMKTLRESNNSIPVIFMSGRNDEEERVQALNMGGDDCISKPFGYPELIARINAVLRRAETSKDNYITQNASVATEPFDFFGAEVNPQRLEVTFPDGETESVGRKEFGIIVYLADNPNVVLTRKDLIHTIWGLHANINSRSLDQYIVKIRNLYKCHNLTLDAIRTVHGIGYICDV